MPRAAVDADIDTANERLAQAGIRLNILKVDMGTGNAGVAFPVGSGANYADGFDATLSLIVPYLTPDENALFGLKDGEKDSIDIFYVDFSTATVASLGARGVSYPKVSNGTGGLKALSNILITSNRTALTLPHEIMHILLNDNHPRSPADPATALFKGGTTPSKDVSGTKRIGPYPAALATGIGNDDTTTIRKWSETLP